MQNTRSQHETSDELCKRHPYYPEDPVNVARFAKEIRPDEVFEAYGDRCFRKLVRVFSNNDLPHEKHVEAANVILDASKAIDKRQDAVTAGTVEIATQRLASASGDVREVAAYVLANLFVLREARTRANKVNAIQALVNLLSDAYGFVRSAASQALATLATSADGIETLCALPSAISSIVRALPDVDGTVGVHQALLQTLCSVSKTAHGVELCLAAHCEQQLMELASVEPLAMVRVATNLSLWPQGRTQLIDIEMMHELGVITRDAGDSELRRLATSCIFALSVHKTAKEQIGSDEVVSESLMQCLSDASKSVQVNAINAIVSASEIPAIQDHFVQLALFEGEVERIFGSAAARSLIPLIREAQRAGPETPIAGPAASLGPAGQPENIIVAAVDVLDALAHVSDEARRDIFDVLHSVETTASLLGHENPLIRRHARELAKALCVDGPSATASRRLRHYILKHADTEGTNVFARIDDALSADPDDLAAAIDGLASLQMY
ncbi:Hypothetical Protein FCC1311_015182 [Hondaea fermentalgiana]|uniref:Uncharacterized protein n=1 Tax=Hondaea fermentalgiana TaxID=2315210 RepID=A0A2R5GB19_9STRA|nr:Hypothetical Protein FCC1311_015182 [Hondaea fermentalgiana]|eukprot:GBG25301.1 Hypothetical Protein FCC1311_015182 [Hondaea fermentalgiana]